MCQNIWEMFFWSNNHLLKFLSPLSFRPPHREGTDYNLRPNPKEPLASLSRPRQRSQWTFCFQFWNHSLFNFPLFFITPLSCARTQSLPLPLPWCRLGEESPPSSSSTSSPPSSPTSPLPRGRTSSTSPPPLSCFSFFSLAPLACGSSTPVRGILTRCLYKKENQKLVLFSVKAPSW